MLKIMFQNIKIPWGAIKELALFVFWIAVIVLPIRFYIAQPFIVNGQSMDPTFKNGQYLLVDQISYRFSEPQRGDVVIFRLPTEPKRYLIKRLVGLPGETIKISGSQVFIKDGDDEEYTPLNEDFIVFNNNSEIEQVLGEGEYFFMGDNRANSADSRAFKAVDRKFIIGRAIIRLFPPTKISWFPGKIEYNY